MKLFKRVLIGTILVLYMLFNGISNIIKAESMPSYYGTYTIFMSEYFTLYLNRNYNGCLFYVILEGTQAEGYYLEDGHTHLFTQVNSNNEAQAEATQGAYQYDLGVFHWVYNQSLQRYEMNINNEIYDGYMQGILYPSGVIIHFESAYQNMPYISFTTNYGLEYGYIEGYTTGYDEGFEIGHDEGYATGYDEGYATGYDEGEEYGKDSAFNTASTWFNGLFTGFQSFFNISIGNTTLGAIILIPFSITFIWFLMRMFRGGGGE